MARSTATIQTTIMNAIAADTTLGPLLTSTSLTAIFRLFAYVIAAVQNLFEQVWDNYLAQIEIYASQTPAGSSNWIALQAFLYQYDSSGAADTNTLTILPNGSLGYTTIDPAFNIVTRCAVTTSGSNEVQIKVAQGTTPVAITGTAFTQLDSYFTSKLGAGINHTLISAADDLMTVLGTVYYKPGYGGVISTNVTNALNAYLSSIAIFSAGSSTPINYEGQIKVSEVIAVIMGTEGVDDFKLDTLKCRADGVIFANSTVTYDLATMQDLRVYTMASGHGILDTTNTNISYTSA